MKHTRKDWRTLVQGIRRRDFLKGAAAIGLGTALGIWKAPAAQATDSGATWAYPDRFSYFPSETMRLHVVSHDTNPQVTVTVYKLTDWKPGDWTPPKGPNHNWSSSGVTFGPHTAATYNGPNNAGQSPVNDWNWAVNVLDIPIGSTWAGVYVAVVQAYPTPNFAIEPTWVEFVVKRPASQPAAPILFKLNVNTVQAYNTGMPAPYASDYYTSMIVVTDPVATGYKVTFRRPANFFGLDHSVQHDYPLLKWLQDQRYDFDCITDVDLDRDTTDLAMLSRYNVVISSGHDEYWTENMRRNLVEYRNRGGNIAFLSANTCCWRVHYTDVDANGGVPTAMICEKRRNGVDEHDINGTDSWWVLGFKDNEIVGVSTRNGGKCADSPSLPLSRTTSVSPGYGVLMSDHWVFESTQLSNGHRIGPGDAHDSSSNPLEEFLIGYEVSGARITHDANNNPVLAGQDGTPANFALLAASEIDGRSGWTTFLREPLGGSPSDPQDHNGVHAATMGLYSAYGSVFTGSTIYWGKILNEWDSRNYSLPRENCALPGNQSHDACIVLQGWTSVPPEDPTDPATPGLRRHILGNQHLHRITRSVLDALQQRRRSVVGIFDSGATTRMILQHEGSGEPSYWTMNGVVKQSAGSLIYDGTQTPGHNERIAGAGTFTDDTSLSLLMQHRRYRNLTYWRLDSNMKRVGPRGDFFGDYQPGEPAPGAPDWQVAVVADLNGDGRPDLLFRDQTSGALWWWSIHYGTVMTRDSAPFYAGWADLDWRPAAVIAFATTEYYLVFQNVHPGAPAEGSLWYWKMMSGASVPSASASFFAPWADRDWRLMGSGKFGDASLQTLIFQQKNNGDLYYWRIAIDSFTGEFTRTHGDVSPRNPWFLPA